MMTLDKSLVLLIFLFLSCDSGTSPHSSEQGSNAQNKELVSTNDQPQPVGLPPGDGPNTPTSFEDLKARAIDENDFVGRAKSALRTLQLEYNKSEGKLPELGKVTILMDNQFNLVIRNELKSDILETVVNLKFLDYSDQGMRLIPDTGPGTYPGIRINTNDGKPHVQVMKNGSIVKEETYLEIFMAERSNIEKLAPAFIQAMMVAQGKT